MFGSDNDGLGSLHNISKMVSSIKAMTSPMNQLSDIVYIKNQFKGVELFSRQQNAIDKLLDLTIPTDKIGRYLELNKGLTHFDHLSGIYPSIPDFSKAWTDQLNFTSSLSRLVQIRGENAFASLRTTVIDSEFQKALKRTSELQETFTKFYHFEDPLKNLKRIRTTKRSPLKDFGDVEQEDIDMATSALNQATSLGLEGAAAERISTNNVKAILKPLTDRLDATDSKLFTRKEFLQALINHIIGFLSGCLGSFVMDLGESATRDEQHEQIMTQAEPINYEIEELKKVIIKEDYRICTSSTFIRIRADTKAKLLTRIKPEDVVLCLTDSSLLRDPKWIYVTFVTEGNVEVSGWSLRARFRKE
jgi:hypothetical protein